LGGLSSGEVGRHLGGLGVEFGLGGAAGGQDRGYHQTYQNKEHFLFHW
jgi:hypothetical protein